MTNGTSTYCPNDCTSLWNGACVSGVCQCTTLYFGVDCSGSVAATNPKFMGVFWFYTAYTILLSSIMTGFAIYFLGQFTLILKKKKTLPKLESPFYVLVIIIIGCFFRIFLYLLDPQNVRRILPVPVYELFYTLPIVFWFEAGYLLLLFWVDMVLCLKELRSSRLKKARIPLIIAFIVTFAAILATGIYSSFTYGTASLGVYDAVLIIILLGFLIFVFVFGTKLYILLKTIATENEVTKNFLNRTIKLMFGINAAIISLVILLIILTFEDSYIWPWIILNFFLRTGEFVGVFQMILVVKPVKGVGLNKSPSKQEESKNSNPRVSNSQLSTQKSEIECNVDGKSEEFNVDEEAST